MKKSLTMRRQLLKKQSLPMEVGVTWYTQEAWARIKAAARDPDRFEATHAQWLAMASKVFADLKAKGVPVVKFHIEPDEFQAWCIVRGKVNDAPARAAFVAEQIRQRQEAGKRP